MKVVTKQSHHGQYGMKKVGDEYETTDRHAQELVNNGLVEAKGLKKEEEKGEHLLVTDKQKEKDKVDLSDATTNKPVADLKLSDKKETKDKTK